MRPGAPLTSKWLHGGFETSGAGGRIQRLGYSKGCFSIDQIGRCEWCIYHKPTGMAFLYSYWPTLTEAKDFAERMMRRGPWHKRNTKEFCLACHDEAVSMGIKKRMYVAIT